jgi:hypothetical protein
LAIGGPDHASNTQFARLYARLAGVPLRISNPPTGMARMIPLLARPVHPDLARLPRLRSLPDDAFDETFSGAAELERRFGVRLTRLEDFVDARVREHAAV